MALPGTPHDQLLYPAGAFACTHPSRLAVLGTLFGMSPAPIEHCRVLELGCGVGANLLPMAAALPGSTFTGIDLAARPIAQGEAIRKSLGLDNLSLQCRDVLDFTPEPGGYDYILAHGLYSWVPPAVQDHILGIIRRGLAGQGVGYVSYNTLPGGYLRRAARDMMMFHTRAIEDPGRRLAQARAIVSFTADKSPPSAGIYKQMMEGQRERLGRLQDGYLFHDDLCAHNEALYFHEFMARAGGHGLMYLADAIYGEMQDERFPAEVRAVLRGAGDILSYEQYLDFLVGRSFRRTLLVQQEATLDRRLVGERAQPCYVLANATSLSPQVEIHSDQPVRFQNPAGLTVGLSSPLVKAALLLLSEHAPCALSFPELLAQVRARIGPDRADTEETEERELGELVLALYGGDMVQLYRHRPRMVNRAGELPLVPRQVRMQAMAGPGVIDLWHNNVKLDNEFTRRVLGLLDGTRDRAALAEALAGDSAAADGGRAEVAGRVETALAELGQMALLQA